MAEPTISRKHSTSNPRNDLSADCVRSILDYNPLTGEFRWRWREGVAKKVNARDAGTIAGSLEAKGYRRIKIDGRDYRAHRLAWLIVTGSWPAEEIDHINLVKDDNRFGNMREATRGENMRNMRVRADNKSGVKGVSWSKASWKWLAHISDENGKLIHLGLFAVKEDAEAAVIEARARLHGEFGRAA